jgi:hypothetical protein
MPRERDIGRNYASGSQKRKLRAVKDDDMNKIPKISNFFTSTSTKVSSLVIDDAASNSESELEEATVDRLEFANPAQETETYKDLPPFDNVSRETKFTCFYID